MYEGCGDVVWGCGDVEMEYNSKFMSLVVVLAFPFLAQ